MTRIPVATIAGSDPSGGAGLQADLRVFTLLGAYGQTVITAITIQNSLGVRNWKAVDSNLVAAQLEAICEDLAPVAIKIGMLATSSNILAISRIIYRFQPLIILDPVIYAQSGDPLLEKEAIEVLKEELFPLATVITPNIPEAEILIGEEIPSGEEGKACQGLLRLGPKAVILKGGHRGGAIAEDFVYDGKEILKLSAPRIDDTNIGHGTGCTFSAALTVFLAQGFSLFQAASKAKQFVSLALLSAQKNRLGLGVAPTDQLIHWERLEAQAQILAHLEKAIEYLARFPVGHLIPEVQSNLVYALPFAQDYKEVGGFPGRIVAIGEKIFPVRCPHFGASKHMARVVLSGMRYDPCMRSAMNIRFDESFITKAQVLGLKVGEFSRKEEPQDIKSKEGSTLCWGVEKVCSRLGVVPDLIFDRGDWGKEPMIRILGKDPMDVVKKVLKFLS